jgi:tRNA(fMet)-specific endonuclease VapC
MGKKKIVLVDTDIFIKVFRGDIHYKEHLDLLAGNIAVSVITVLELYQGANTKRRKFDLEKQLKAYHIVHVDEKISAAARLLTKKYLPEKKLLPPDCLIAATALNFSFELFTDNKKDFDFIKGVKFYKY